MKKRIKNKGILTGGALYYNAQDLIRYRNELTRLVRTAAKYTKREVRKMFEGETAETYFATDASVTAAANKLVNKLKGKFAILFNKPANTIAEKMVLKANRTSVAAVGISLKELSQGFTISTKRIPEELREVMKASIAENTALIKTIPQQYLSQVEKLIYNSITSGTGMQGLIPQLQKYEGISYRRARTIAVDQTRKVYNGINAARMKSVNIGEFEWIHSGGAHHPRPSHVALNGTIHSLDNLPVINLDDQPNGPPIRGLPGQLYFCGCIMRPIIRLEEDEE